MKIVHVSVAGRKIGGGKGNIERRIELLTPLLQDMKMGAKIDEREARRDKVVIEFPTTQNTIHLTHYTHNLTLSQA